MHSKSSFGWLRLAMLAPIAVAASVLALAFGLDISTAAPEVQGKTTIDRKVESRRVGNRHDSKADAFLSQPAVRASLEEIKLTDPNGVEEDALGWSVAISGTTAVVGTLREKVHVFVQRDDVWELQQTLPVDTNEEDDADRPREIPVAIDKDTIVAGAFGIAYVYVRTGTTWSLQTSLISPVSTENPFYGGSFGGSVGVSGNTVIVGASGVDDQAGAVYFYERSGTNWSGPLKVSADDHFPGPERDIFGWSVAIDGDTAVVGAPNQQVVDDGPAHEEGAAYVYVRSGGEWVEQGYLVPDENEIGTASYLGSSLALSGNTIVVSGHLDERAFVYARQGTSWTEQQVLRAPDGHFLDRFGFSLATNGETIVVGAYGTEDLLGTVFIYDRSGTTWFLRDTLEVTNGEPTQYYGFAFGHGVGISGETIIVGAPNEKIEGNDFQGAAYIFRKLDSDGDALADDWEEEGITVDDNGRVVGTGNLEGEGTFIDLPAMGANPMHKDVFVHVDWMEPNANRNFEPKPRSIGMVIDAFATAPVTNPDLKPGINLHVDFGPDSIMKYVDGEPETWGDLSEAGEVPFQEVVDTTSPPTAASYDSALLPFKDLYFDPAQRSAVFHYVLYCKEINVEEPGGLGSLRGTDFLVSFDNQVKPITQAGTFMHELGHNLGLEHGGDDDVNYKPNYISIMNYRFESLGTLRSNGRQRYLDFSREALDTLDETELDENLGINDTAGHLTTWNIWTRQDDPPQSNRCVANRNFYYRLFYPSGALDWNCDGVRSMAPITPDPVLGGTDLNSDGKCVAPSRDPDGSFVLHTTPAPGDVVIGAFISSGPNRQCETTASGGDRQLRPVGFEEPELLEGFDDWEALVFDGENKIGRLSGGAATLNRVTVSVRTSGLSRELSLAEMEAELPPALVNEELIAPVDVVSMSLHTGAAPLPVNFDGSASTAVNGTIVDWQWDFGDGTSGSGATVTHTYTALGDYFATLTVTDNNGHVNLVPLLNRVTVTSFHPNLAPFQPPAWSDKIVVSTVTGTNTDSAELTTNNILYIDSAVINNGTGPTTADFVTRLYVDGIETQTFLTTAPLSINSVTAVQDLALGPLTAGQHTLRIVADDTGAIAETNESDNEYSRVISISSASPTPTPTPTGQANLTPHQPPGWPDKIVVSTSPSTHDDSTSVSEADSLYVDFAIINNGNIATETPFTITLYLDTVAIHSFVADPLSSSSYIFFEDFPLGHRGAGQHVIKIVADVNGQIVESDETDNEYSKQFNISPAPPTPTPTPTPLPTPTPTPISQTYVVKNTNNSGPESLRQALIDANSHPNGSYGIDQISFNIPGAGVHTIAPLTRLPAVSDPVLIDGYTQPGSSANTLAVGNNAVLLIELSGVNMTQGGLDLTGGNSTVRGLVLNHFLCDTFGDSAIRLGSSNNVVAGNFIGINAAGTASAHNFPLSVIIATGANNLIGGTTPADRNVISGNATSAEPATGVGLQIRTTQPGTRVQGNYIGTNAAGNAALGNGRGIDVIGSASADITIGGLTNTPGTGAGNVISGNSSNGGINSYGIYIGNRPGDLRIQGNLIGLDAAGTTGISNGVSGIQFEDATPGTSLLLVGGTEAGARNVIFNNRISGIVCNAIGLLVQGNFIGTDITGTFKPPLAPGSLSGGDGILVGGGTVTIGGNASAARSVISGNGIGLHVLGGVVTVQGNYVGTTVDGISPLGNLTGVRVENDAVVTIGGTGVGQGNVIAHNFEKGVRVKNTAHVAILGNSIFDNSNNPATLATLGIDLADDNVTANDGCDSDSGPNNLQNFPVPMSALTTGDQLTITGALNSTANTQFTIEFFSNAVCNRWGYGEGRTFLGSATVTTDASCGAGINVTLPVAVPEGQFITATATDPNGNTSEFSACVAVAAPPPPPIPPATLGNYPDTTVDLSLNTTVTPDAGPTNTTSINVSTDSRFKGTLAADPTTGVIRVTNAHPAGVYTMVVKAQGTGGSATTTFTLMVQGGTACSGPVAFTNGANVSAGATPVSVSIGDFNNDGRQDFAVANYGDNSVSIREGDGSGGFSGAMNVSVGATPFSVAIGDFNSDGKQDFATANYGANSVSIRLGDGLGGFSGATNISVGANPSSIAIGDFNNDDKQDFATANESANSVSIRLGDGLGGFSGATNISVDANPFSVAIGDFNHDGKQDFATANFGANTVSIRLGDGLGGFSGATDVLVGAYPLSVAIGDFNNDGKQDFVTANYSSNTVSIRLGTGSGGFSSATDISVGENPYSVAIGDFNNDGKQDFASANYSDNTVSIRLGDGSGNFGVAPGVSIDGNPYSLAIGDFNGDGRQDLAAATLNNNNTLSIRLGSCNVAPTPNIVPAEANLVNESCPPVNSAIDPGERVTVYLKLMNTGTGSTGNLVATLQSLGGVIAPSDPQTYGAIAAAETVGRDFTFTLDPSTTSGQTITATLQLQDDANNLGTVSFSFTAGPRPCGEVRLVVSSTALQRFQDTVTTIISVQNIGTLPANNVSLTTAMLGSIDGSAAMPNLGTINIGASASTQISFTTAATGGSTLKVSGTYETGNSGRGMFTSTKRVTIPSAAP